MATIIVGATAGTVDLRVRRGDKIGPLEFSFSPVVDLSDRTWAAQVRASLDEPADLTSIFDVDDSDAATGVITITLPASESANLATVNGKATYYWDLQATDNSDPDSVFTWVAGKVKVGGDVTVTA